MTRFEKRDLSIPAKILEKGNNRQRVDWSFRYSLLFLTSHKHGGNDFMKREDSNVFRIADGKSLTEQKIFCSKNHSDFIILNSDI